MSGEVVSGDVLRQLEFELEEARGSRFLLAVCDDDERATDLRRALADRLKSLGSEIVSISASTITGSLVDTILRGSKSGSPAAVHLVQGKKLAPVISDKLFRELNFQRDSLARLQIPIIVWIYGHQLSKLASRAPDFWSRRTAIFYFDRLSIGVLLNRIFSEHGFPGDVTADEISKALAEALSSERELLTCLSNRDEFSLPKADGVIQRLRNSIQKLLHESSKGRKIDVALWLWNASQMDAFLQKKLRMYFHSSDISAYLDRNELLLSLAERIDRLLQQYLQQLDERIRQKHPISLIGLFSAYAANIWKNKVRHASHDAMRMFRVAPYDIPEPASASGSWVEDVFKSRAVQQLEAWLAGDIEERPPIFSDEEAAILRYLYQSKGNRSLKSPVPRPRIKQLVPQLQAKVRLFVGDIESHFGDGPQ